MERTRNLPPEPPATQCSRRRAKGDVGSRHQSVAERRYDREAMIERLS